MSDQDPTKPVSNDEKFKPQNVADPVKSGRGGKGKDFPGSTDGNDVERGSSGETKKTPAA